jgi:hypothetical protein
MIDKKYLIKPEEIKVLTTDQRGCVASDKITVEGMKIGYIYRESPDGDIENDSGWRFLSGTESEEYADDYNNSEIFTINTIVNYDPAILPYIKNSVGIELERIEGTDKFRKIED